MFSASELCAKLEQEDADRLKMEQEKAEPEMGEPSQTEITAE